MKKSPSMRRAIIIAAVLASIIMYFAGVFSGLNANKIIKKDVQKDVEFLESYVDTASLDLKNLLLLQLFTENLEDKCEFSRLYLIHLHDQLHEYWEKLPARLEAYERQNPDLSFDYITLKREYIRYSLRIWLIANNNIKYCDDPEYLPILTFYSRDCEDCVRQGEIFDKFSHEMRQINKTVLTFPIDIDFNDDSVYLLKRYYNISSLPAAIIGNTVYQGRILSLTTLRTYEK